MSYNALNMSGNYTNHLFGFAFLSCVILLR